LLPATLAGRIPTAVTGLRLTGRGLPCLFAGHNGRTRMRAGLRLTVRGGARPIPRHSRRTRVRARLRPAVRRRTRLTTSRRRLRTTGLIGLLTTADARLRPAIGRRTRLTNAGLGTRLLAGGRVRGRAPPDSRTVRSGRVAGEEALSADLAAALGRDPLLGTRSRGGRAGPVLGEDRPE
jgi:hypothetical protein